MMESLEKIYEEEMVNALLSNERATILKEKKELSEYKVDNISNWLNLKSLVKENEFKERLKFEKIEESDFNLGIKELSDSDKEILLENLKKSDWFKLFEEIMDTFDNVDKIAHENGVFEEIKASYIIRPFIYMIEKNIVESIKSLNNFKITEDAIRQLMGTFTTKIFIFYNKVFIIELNKAKEDLMLKGDTGEERFKYFLQNFFKDKEQLLRFYYKYPVLTRLATTKTKFILDFITNAIENIDNHYNEIQRMYPGQRLEKIEEISSSEGDSHEQGKSVIIFKFKDNVKLIYKPRDLRILSSYNEFIDWINENSELLDIAKTQGIYYKDYSFEKFVEHKSCDNKDQIRNYYKRFGHIVAISHILCANDLHYENLIASGEHPTIIDLETIVQAEPQLKMSKEERASVYVKKDIIMNSVQFTALLPKIDFNNNKEGKGMDISALDGKASKLPFKILAPININTDEYRMSYQEYTMEGSNNIPKLNGYPIYFTDYKVDISSGFYEMMNFFMNKKYLLISDKSKLNVFRGHIVRNVIKGTQLYMNMLNYSNHPNYAQDMLKREKLMENIWSYPYKNKEVIKYEYRELMFDDIPVFFSYTDSKDLLSSNKHIIKDYFQESGLSKVYKRIEKLSESEIEKQNSILEVTLGKYDEVIEKLKGNREYIINNNIEIDILKEAKDIGDFILSKGLTSEQGNQLAWADININGVDTTKWNVSNIDCSLYDGLSGIALFMLELYLNSQENKYFEAYEKIMVSAIKEAEFENNVSAYKGKISILLPVLRDIQKNGESKFIYYIEEVKSFIKENMNNTKQIDWLGGYAGIIAIMLNTYKIINDKECLDISISLGNKICENLEIDTFNNVGYGHGCSGIAIALIRLHEFCKIDKFLNVSEKLIERERQLMNEENYKDPSKWCWGSTGIGLSRIELYKKFNEKSMLYEIHNAVKKISHDMKKDDCLCHGNMADIEFLNQYRYVINNSENLFKTKMSDVYLNKTINDKYSVRSIPQFMSVSLFTGLSGIGYELLRIYNRFETSNVLTLELGD